MFFLFALKYFLLVLTQLAMVKDIGFLKGQCMIIDFLLKASLQIGDWLFACVATERLTLIIKGVNFKKTLSRKVAKWMLSFVCIFVIGKVPEMQNYSRIFFSFFYKWLYRA